MSEQNPHGQPAQPSRKSEESPKDGDVPKKDAPPETKQPISGNLDNLIKEAEAMATYVSRHGDVLGEGGAELHEALLNAIKVANSTPTPDTWVALHKSYAAVTAKTYPTLGVNGRTVLDTQEPATSVGVKSFRNPRYRPVCVGLILFVLALILEILAHWAGRVSDPAGLGLIKTIFYDIADALLTFLIPATWGGIGACIFLMKRLSDKLFEMAFEKSRVRGDMTRVFLGAMLGVVVVVLIFPGFGESIQVGEVTFGPATAAFLAGLGVKPIYAAFESLSEELAKRFQGKKA